MAFEKVNASHPDKCADRIAGALVDYCYSKEHDPRCAFEVLIGHGLTTIIGETSVMVPYEEVVAIVERIIGKQDKIVLHQVPQDPILAHNQDGVLRAADNGIFRGCAPTHEQKLLTAIATSIYDRYPTDGKYVISDAYYKPDFDATMRIPARTGHFQTSPKHLTVCQSNATKADIYKLLADFEKKYTTDTEERLTVRINPLGEWTGGPNTDSGATNRKLGSDLGDGVTGGGLCGKDLSKGDVSINIVCFLKAVQSGQTVTACCSIGDEQVTFTYADGKRETETFADVVEMARLYILTDCNGSFEKFAEWGLIRAKDL